MAENLCKDCEKRKVGCHIDCSDYAKFKAAQIERSRKITEGRMRDKHLSVKWSNSMRKKLCGK